MFFFFFVFLSFLFGCKACRRWPGFTTSGTCFGAGYPLGPALMAKFVVAFRQYRVALCVRFQTNRTSFRAQCVELLLVDLANHCGGHCGVFFSYCSAARSKTCNPLDLLHNASRVSFVDFATFLSHSRDKFNDRVNAAVHPFRGIDTNCPLNLCHNTSDLVRV